MRCAKGIKLHIFLVVLSIVSALFFSPYACFAQDRARVVIFPFENLTPEGAALSHIMPVVREKLEKKGVDLVDGFQINNFMIKERIRSTGNISRDVLLKAKKELSADYFLLGTIHNFYISENPQVGISARLIEPETGDILWTDYSSNSGEDFLKLLGIGAIRNIDKLVEKVVDRLFTSFNSSNPKEKETTYRIGVIPLKNKGKMVGAGNIVAHMFVVELFKSQKFVPVDYGFIKNASVLLMIWPKGEMDYLTIDAVSEYLGVDAILIGTVEAYPDRDYELVMPEVEVSARLIDVRKKRIIWSDNIRLDRDAEIYLFDWGRITTTDKIAQRVVSRLVRGMEKARWQ